MGKKKASPQNPTSPEAPKAEAPKTEAPPKKKGLRKNYRIGGKRYEKGTAYSKDLADLIKAHGGNPDSCFE